MNYSDNTRTINGKVESIDSFVTSVKKLNMDSVWKGAVATSYIEYIDNIMTKINKEKENIQTFNDVLDKVEELKNIDKAIDRNKSSLDGFDPNNENHVLRISQIKSMITRLTNQRNELKRTIINLLGKITSDNTSLSLDFSLVSWNELNVMVQKFSSLPVGNIFDRLTLRDSSGNVIRDGKEYFDNVINSIRQKYTGVERNYYMSLAIVNMSLEAGVRVPYVHAGTIATGKTEDTRIAVDSSTFNIGIDCNAFVSFLIFDENSTVKWLDVAQYYGAGDQVAYGNAQPGDIFANGGHVGMIVDYNPETGEYVILHASSPDRDMQFEVVTEAYFRQYGHQIRRVDSTYVSPTLQNSN